MRVLGKSPLILTWLLLLVFASWFWYPLAVLVAAVLGIWMVIGRDEFWLRVLFAVVYFLPCLQRPYEMAFELFVLMSSVLISFLATMILKKLNGASIRGAQFGLWEVGGWMLTLGFIFTFFRFADLDQDHIDIQEVIVSGVIAIWFAINVVLACLPFLVPEQERSSKLWLVAVLSTLLVMPLIEISLINLFLSLINELTFGNMIWTALASVFFRTFGLFYVYFLTWPMDVDGYFRSDDPKKELT